MFTIRKAEDRGHFDHGWLDTRHTFSFSSYYDPRHMGYRDLRVINEDRVQPGQGFGTHPHDNMEIISYVLEGALEHRDSMGTGSVIHAGEVQRMTAGTGVTHSEYNHSDSEIVHFLQIWILPNETGLAPGYEQKTFSDEQRNGRLCLIAAPDGAEGAVTIHQDARLYTTHLAPGQDVTFDMSEGRHAWIQVTRGSVTVNDQTLEQGDGASLSEENAIRFTGRTDAELLLFDLA